MKDDVTVMAGVPGVSTLVTVHFFEIFGTDEFTLCFVSVSRKNENKAGEGTSVITYLTSILSYLVDVKH